MATPATPEAIEIRRRGRRRLIGAIAIVILLVVFVPMVLDSEQRTPHTDPSLEIPKKDAAPLPAPAKAPAQPAAKEAPSAAPPTEPRPAPKIDNALVPKGTPPAPKLAPPTPAATPRLEGFAVQVGAFRDEEKLKHARDKLAGMGISHYVERRGDLNRLRAGPFSTREAAEKALASIKSASLEGQVVPLP